MDREVSEKKNTLAAPQVIKRPNLYSHKPRYLQHSRDRSDKSKEVERPVRGLNLIEFSLKKLPLFPLDKIALAGSNLLIDEGALLIGGNYAKRDSNRFDKTFSTYEAMCRPRVRNTSKQLAFFKEKPNLEQELPYLCIMSETKKQRQIEKMNQKTSDREQLSRNEARTFHNSILNGHRPQNAGSISKYRQRRKNIEAISKMRMSPYTRYDQPRNNDFCY